MSISLLNVAKFYKELPHQKQALQILQRQIESTHPTWLADASEFVKTWRTPVVNPSAIPQAQIISDGKQLKAEWLGKTFTINATDFTVRVMNAPDPKTGQIVAKQMRGDRISAFAIHPTTGNIAVGVVLQYFAATTTSAVFIVDPQTGGYAIYRVQVPGNRDLSDEFSTYALDVVQSVNFLEDNLFVKQIDAAGAQSLLVFKPRQTPAMKYAGSVSLKTAESNALYASAGSH